MQHNNIPFVHLYSIFNLRLFLSIYFVLSERLTLKKYKIEDPESCVCVCVCVCDLETIKVVIKFGRVTASNMRMHHVLIILTLTFFQGHTDLNHENNKCSIISETVQAIYCTYLTVPHRASVPGWLDTYRNKIICQGPYAGKKNSILILK